MKIHRLAFLAVFAAVLLGLLSGCAPAGSGKIDTSKLKMAPLSQMPEDVQKGSTTIQEAYRFNVANPGLMKQIPCYCGCGAVGHTSNYDCYVKDDSGSTLVFDQHALGCSICLDITLDAMRLTSQGKDAKAVRAYVDQAYSKFGPSNIP